MFQECSSSTHVQLFSLYELGNVFLVLMQGPSQFGSSLPFPSILVVQTRTMSPLKSLGMMDLSLQAFVVDWYLFSILRTSTQNAFRRTIIASSSTSRATSRFVHGEPCLSSYMVISLAPYISLKVINPITWDFIVLSPLEDFEQLIVTFSLLSSSKCFLIAVNTLPFARSTTPFACGCYTYEKMTLVPMEAHKFINFWLSNCLLLFTVTYEGTPN